MRPSYAAASFVVFAPARAAVSSSATITSMPPMMAPSAPPVTMAWNDAPAATGSAMSMASGMSMESGMSMASGMTMSMKSDMTMSSGMMMPTGDAMAAMAGMSGMSGNKTSNAGNLELSSGLFLVMAVLGML